uniref:Mediator of RNA polymerase II transcription subunit 20 n=1 Tax=Eptatretus burgeri TaxID=7764 RepID=A0A8C4QR25_EPTBU
MERERVVVVFLVFLKNLRQETECVVWRDRWWALRKAGKIGIDCNRERIQIIRSYTETGWTRGPQGQKTLYVMHSTEFPLSCFALYEGGPCMTADANFTALMLRLKGAFQNAKGSKIEARGQRYRYADFYVRLGAVTMGPSTKGVSVEVSEHMDSQDGSKGMAPFCRERIGKRDQRGSLTVVSEPWH